LNRELVESLQKPLEAVEVIAGTNVVILASARKAIQQAKKNAESGSLALVSTTEGTSDTNVLAIPVPNLDDYSDEQIADYITNTRKLLAAIPRNVKVYVSQDMFEPLMAEHQGVVKALAQTIFERTGFALPILNETFNDTLSDRAKLLIKRGELLSGYVEDPATLTKVGDDYELSIRSSKKFNRTGRINQGSIIALGKDDKLGEIYGYVFEVSEDLVAKIKPFTEDIFELLNDRVVPLDVFEQAVEDKRKC
jgi:hypothetical protein